MLDVGPPLHCQNSLMRWMYVCMSRERNRLRVVCVSALLIPPARAQCRSRNACLQSRAAPWKAELEYCIAKRRALTSNGYPGACSLFNTVPMPSAPRSMPERRLLNRQAIKFKGLAVTNLSPLSRPSVSRARDSNLANAASSSSESSRSGDTRKRWLEKRVKRKRKR